MVMLDNFELAYRVQITAESEWDGFMSANALELRDRQMGGFTRC
jgi:hypothetical protein